MFIGTIFMTYIELQQSLAPVVWFVPCLKGSQQAKTWISCPKVNMHCSFCSDLLYWYDTYICTYIYIWLYMYIFIISFTHTKYIYIYIHILPYTCIYLFMSLGFYTWFLFSLYICIHYKIDAYMIYIYIYTYYLYPQHVRYAHEVLQHIHFHMVFTWFL